MEIGHEEFITILNEKDEYEIMKEDIKMIKSSDELNKEERKKKNKKNKFISKNKRNARKHLRKILTCIKCLN